jgi:ribose-phosphate pyrophosphokinase
MKVFSTRSSVHLIKEMNIDRGAVKIENFSDGELYLKIEDDVAHQNVFVLASTQTPADNLLELYFMLDALQRMKAKIHLLIPYFGYARQDRAEFGEALSCEVVFRFLQQFNIAQTIIIHIHNPRVRMFYDFEDIILLDFYLSIIEHVDCLVAPDEGAADFVNALAQEAKKPMTIMHKVRSGHEKINRLEFDYNVEGKKVLIVDDMIATGGTLCKAAEVLHKHNASAIYAAATHGVFSANAYSAVEDSYIEKLYVTNTLPQKENKPKIMVVDIATTLEHLILSL